MIEPELSRRALGRTIAAAVSLPTLGRAFTPPDDPGFLVRGDRPLNLETPVDRLGEARTETKWFFVRSHFGPPAVGLHPWSIHVTGLVREESKLELGEIGGTGTAELAAVLQCAGNGRAFFEPAVSGVPWERGGVGQADWRGVRLRDLLESVGIDKSAKHVHVLGGDPPPHPKTPALLRSLPIDRAMDESTLLATHMNGEPLPIVHGGPVRLVVPGWTGNHWIKWVRAIVCSETEAPGFYQQTGYRIPKRETPPGVEVKPEDTVPVTWMNVKSLITRPTRGEKLATGRIELRGVAWTGEGTVTRVEISVDGAPWRDALLTPPRSAHAWSAWSLALELGTGKHRIRARATDSAGSVQPERTPWNKSGYLWNGIDEIEIQCGN